MIPESIFVSSVTLGNLQGADGNTEADNIGCNMSSIGEDSDGVGEVATSDLNANEDAGGGQDKSELSHGGMV